MAVVFSLLEMTTALDSVRPRMKATARSRSRCLQGALDDARIHQVEQRVVHRPR